MSWPESLPVVALYSCMAQGKYFTLSGLSLLICKVKELAPENPSIPSNFQKIIILKLEKPISWQDGMFLPMLRTDSLMVR